MLHIIAPRKTTILVAALIPTFLCLPNRASADEAKPGKEKHQGATERNDLSSDGVRVSHLGQSLHLELSEEVAAAGKATIPRLCASIRSLGWEGHPDAALRFVPEPDHWVFSWKNAPPSRTIVMELEQSPTLLSKLELAPPSGDGSVLLHAYQATTTGEKLRFEPQWYKNTVGYWTIPTDYATWSFSVDQPGTFSVALLQGCGKGQGGSDALLTILHGDATAAKLEFQTIDTGHFQNFRWNHLGHVTIPEAGEYRLRISPVRIAKAALFDVRNIHLVRQAGK